MNTTQGRFEVEGELVTTTYPDGSVLTETGRTFYWKADPPTEPHLPSMSGEWVEYKPFDT